LSRGDYLGHVVVDSVPFLGQYSGKSGKPDRGLIVIFSSPLGWDQGNNGTTPAHDTDTLNRHVLKSPHLKDDFKLSR
jgi:hypothetical protein